MVRTRFRPSGHTSRLISLTFALLATGTALAEDSIVCSTPGASIPDGSGSLSDSLDICLIGTITDLNVSLDISHTWVGDLIVTLTHDDTGTSITLIQEPLAGTCSGANIDVLLDDEASQPVTGQCDSVASVAISGEFQPEVGNLLSDFDEEFIDGSWTLNVADTAAQDQGTLHEWCLESTFEPAACLDCDCDGIFDGNDNCPMVANPGQEDDDLDGVGNLCDNCLDVPNPDQCNTNGNGTSFGEDNIGNVCDADLDGNGIVNSFDLTILRQNFGATGENDADINCNGIVNSFDLTLVRQKFGQAPGPTGIR